MKETESENEGPRRLLKTEVEIEDLLVCHTKHYSYIYIKRNIRLTETEI